MSNYCCRCSSSGVKAESSRDPISNILREKNKSMRKSTGGTFESQHKKERVPRAILGFSSVISCLTASPQKPFESHQLSSSSCIKMGQPTQSAFEGSLTWETWESPWRWQAIKIKPLWHEAENNFNLHSNCQGSWSSLLTVIQQKQTSTSRKFSAGSLLEVSS